MNSTPVIPKGRPELPLLDYEVLRTEGIRHLEQLATEIWTDFNAHDPGITILEVLCYVLTDLGYRTHLLPIEDLVTPGNLRSHFFLADEILTSRPVTANDYRRLILDVEGVRNAWVAKALDTTGTTRIHVADDKFEFARQLSDAIAMDEQTWIITDAEWKKIMSGLYPDQVVPQRDIDALATYMQERTSVNWKLLPAALRDEITCYFGRYYLLSPGTVEPLLHVNGIYAITLDLDNSVDYNNPRDVDAVVEKVLASLHANRGICQDFEPPVVLETVDVCLRLDLDVHAEFDEYKVLAEVIWNLQNYLTPSVQFHTFREMVTTGTANPGSDRYAVEQIFSGPLLEHGFLDDDELHEAQRRTTVSRSDLMGIIRKTPGVTGIQKLQIKVPDQAVGSIGEENSFEIKDPISGREHLVKWKINPCCSCFNTRSRNFSTQIKPETLVPYLDHLDLIHGCRMCGIPGGPEVPAGVYRADLANYRSIQYEFPNNYTLGDNPVPEADGPTRRAQARQLQAYLLFYDRILAGYLRQLGNLRDLFSVRQQVDMPAMKAVALYEVPGVRDLLQDFGTYYFDGPKLLAFEDSEIKNTPLWKRLNDLANEYDGAKNVPKPVYQKQAFVAKVSDGLEPVFALYKDEILDVAFAGGPDDTTWFHDTDAKTGQFNPYIVALQRLVENEAQKDDRHNRLLNHLLARFGEQFTEFSLALLRSDEFPEDNTWQQPFSQYLRAKANYLHQVPIIGAERGQGYNYRLFDPKGKNPDVWNSLNVSGLKKRAYAMLGIEDYKEQTLFAEPDYALRIERNDVKQGRPYWLVYLVERSTGNRLMKSEKIAQNALAIDLVKDLHKTLRQETRFHEIKGAKKGQMRVVFLASDQKKPPLLASADIPDGESDRFLRRVVRLISKAAVDREGFHLVEHLLLRPDDMKDYLLQIPLDCAGLMKDPYSFWLTVVLPDWPGRFANPQFQHFVETTLQAEAPAHLALRLLWLDYDKMKVFEEIFKEWLEEKARCRPNACHVTDSANALILFLQANLPACPCRAETKEEEPCRDFFPADKAMEQSNNYEP